MSVTVVVPTVGRSELIRASVGTMVRAAERMGPDAEVLVVANGCAEVPALRHLGTRLLRVVHLDRANVSRARNAGIELARHHTVLFGDDGAAVGPTWCADFAEALRDPRFPVVTAPVRVPATGPVTAYLNYQRLFDAPPENADMARTVTGHCALRRDRLPATVRYDEDHHPAVGEDVAFGHALRAMGIPIRWLAGMAPGWHLLPERIDEVTDRAFRYGRGSALAWSAVDPEAADPAEILTLYRYVVSTDHLFHRRFTEVDPPGLRAAWTAYDYLHDVAHFLGYLVELGTSQPVPLVDLEWDRLRTAWRDIARRAGTAVEEGSWRNPRLDYGRLDRVPVAPDPLVAEAREALLRYAAPTLDRLPARLAGTRGPGAAGHAVDVGRLMAAWNAARSARAGEGWTEVDAVDRWARAAGSTFRDACSTVERVGMVRYAVANGHPIPPAPTGYRRLPDGRWVWGAVSEPAPRPSPTGER